MDILDIILGSEMAADETASQVINLTDFQCDTDIGVVTFNDVITMMFMGNLSKGGGTVVNTVQDIDRSFHKACTAKHNFKMRINMGDNGIVDFPVAYGFAPSDGAGQLSGSFVMTLDGSTYFETVVNIQFDFQSATTLIFNRVTIINAG